MEVRWRRELQVKTPWITTSCSRFLPLLPPTLPPPSRRLCQCVTIFPLHLPVCCHGNASAASLECPRACEWSRCFAAAGSSFILPLSLWNMRFFFFFWFVCLKKKQEKMLLREGGEQEEARERVKGRDYLALPSLSFMFPLLLSLWKVNGEESSGIRLIRPTLLHVASVIPGRLWSARRGY